MAVQDYELLLRVRADLMEAINGLKGLTSAMGQGDGAAQQLGESADQASTRIQKMVQASLDQQRAAQGATAATRDAAEQTNATIRAYDAQAAAAQRAAAANVDYNRSFAQAGGNGSATAAKTAALVAQREEMAKLAGQIDPTINALKRLDDQEKSLNAMRKAGVVGLEDYARFKAVIDANRASITGAAGAMHTFNLNTAQTRLDLGRLIKDISTGQWGRLASTGTTLANQAGFISALFSPVGLTIAAVTGSLIAFGVAAQQVANEQNKFNEALAKTGSFAGTTAAGMEQLTNQIAGSNARLGDARTIITALAASGRVSQGALASMGQAALDMAQLTGESADKAADAVLHMFDGTTASLIKANDQYHFLTSAVYDQIAALQEQGDTQAAMDVAAQAFHDAAQQRIEDEKEQVRGLARVWDSVKDSIIGAWNATKTAASIIVGTADDQSRLYELEGRKARAQENIDDKGRYNLGQTLRNAVGLGYSPDDDAEIERLKAKIQSDTQKAELTGLESKLNDGAVKADAALDELGKSLDKTAAKQAALTKLNADFLALWNGDDPSHPNPRLKGVQAITGEDGKVTFSGGLYDQLRAGIDKRYTQHAPRQKSDSGAVAAQQELIKLLNTEQGALDPVAKAWADYNNKVAQANQLAEKAKTARGADVAAIDAQRNAVIANAAAVRDAAIDKEATKDRDAFEKMQQSLQNANGIKFEQLTGELAKLQQWLEKGVITADEYHKAVGGVLDTGLKPLHKYKGLDGAVGGAFGELDKINAAGSDLDSQYTAQLQALNKWHAQALLSDQDYVTKENALYTQYYDQKKQLQDASNLALITGMNTSLEQSAQLVMKSVGKNSEAYRIAFAASKAAAIAQATMNMFKAISNAGADVPFPANIPAMAAVGASMVALLAQITSVNAGFAGGGYTGPGAVHQPAGIVHAGEVVFSQADVARHGGVGAVESLRLRGYADGGIVWPAPPLPDGGTLTTAMANAAAANRGGAAAQEAAAPGQTHIHVWSMEQAAEEIAKLPAFQKAVVHVVGDNPRTIQGKWGRGS